MDLPFMQISSTGQTGPAELCCEQTSTQVVKLRCFEQIYPISQWGLLLWPRIPTTVSWKRTMINVNLYVQPCETESKPSFKSEVLHIRIKKTVMVVGGTVG